MITKISLCVDMQKKNYKDIYANNNFVMIFIQFHIFRMVHTQKNIKKNQNSVETHQIFHDHLVKLTS